MQIAPAENYNFNLNIIFAVLLCELILGPFICVVMINRVMVTRITTSFENTEIESRRFIPEKY